MFTNPDSIQDPHLIMRKLVTLSERDVQGGSQNDPDVTEAEFTFVKHNVNSACEVSGEGIKISTTLLKERLPNASMRSGAFSGDLFDLWKVLTSLRKHGRGRSW